MCTFKIKIKIIEFINTEVNTNLALQKLRKWVLVIITVLYCFILFIPQ